MAILEILFDLFSAIPFLFLMGFISSLALHIRAKQKRSAYKVACFLFGGISLLFSNYHYNALFGAGPLGGKVVDFTTGLPIEGVEVVARWRGNGRSPIAMPAWTYWLKPLIEFPCEVASETSVSDADGRFYSGSWYGTGVWKGCGRGFYETAVYGYESTHYNSRDEAIGYSVSLFESPTIKLSRSSGKQL